MKKLLGLLALLTQFSLLANPDSLITDIKIGSISGKVIDKSLQAPVAYAAIVIKSTVDQSTITGIQILKA